MNVVGLDKAMGRIHTLTWLLKIIKLILLLENMNKKLITTIEEFNTWWESEWRPIMGIDFETTSLKYLEMELDGFSMCNGTAACYVNFPIHKTYDMTSLFYDIDWTMHKASFDLKCMNKFWNFTPKKIFCTLTGAKLVNENLPKGSYSLKSLAHIWLGIPEEQIKSYDEVSHNVNSPEFYDYGMDDSIWTYQLREYETKILKKEKLMYLMDEVENPFQFVLRDLEINGVLIDRDKLEVFKDECKDLLISIERDMLGVFGKTHSIQRNLFGEQILDSPINFGSSQQLVNCIEQLGFKVIERTKPSKRFPKTKTSPGGQPSVNAKTKQRLKEKHPFFKLLWRHGKLTKLYNSFLLPCAGFIDSDGRVRPSYQMVRTGRLSCSEPNLQQLPNPKKGDLEFNFREIVVPKPGNVIVRGDWSGQELRVLAEVSKDEKMLGAFNNSYDLHLFTANRVFDLSLPDVAFKDGTRQHDEACKIHGKVRHQAKNGVNFPIVYGAYAKRIGEDNGVSTDEAQRWLDEFDALYPGVKKAVARTRKEVASKGYVRTLMGRKRRFPYYHSVQRYEKGKMERQAFNVKIQGFSADCMKIASVMMIPVCEEYGAMPIKVVHDELVFECPEEKAKAFAAKLKEVQEHCVCISVPLPAEVDCVSNYGE